MITAKAPGKLYIAGEYAVVETGHPAILVALNQFATCTITARHGDQGQIISDQYQNNALSWRRRDGHLVIDGRDNPFTYILAAIQVTEEYARAHHRQLGLYDLRIDSQLDSAAGKKYGLGSSAAVTVATVKALCAYYHLPTTLEILFKLAALAHFTVQGNGSLGDVAASVYGGWIAYHSFDRQWLINQRASADLPTLLALPWPRLRIESLTAPRELALLIGWTGKPASTSRLVDRIARFKAQQPRQYQHFLAASRACLKQMVTGFHRGSLPLIQEAVRKNRQALRQLATQSGVAIETPRLTELCQIANRFGGAAKTSGAGGGDCGIAILSRATDLTRVLHEWAAKQIEPLPLTVCPPTPPTPSSVPR